LLTCQPRSVWTSSQDGEPGKRTANEPALAGTLPKRNEHDAIAFHKRLEGIARTELQFLANNKRDDNLTFGRDTCSHGKTILP